MADKTKIEWCRGDDGMPGATWNPIRGCSRVSAGCQHCYAERVAGRFSGPGQPYEGLIHPKTKGWNGKVRFIPDALDQPLRWRRPRRIFVNSMSDLFHENLDVRAINAIFGIMAACPQHTFQVLTKRPERMRDWARGIAQHYPHQRQSILHEALKGAMGYEHPRRPAVNEVAWPLPNVWLGTSVEDQATADERIPLLLETPAAVRWISAEPMLGPIDLTLDGLVCGPCRSCIDKAPDPETNAVECRACDCTGKGDEWELDWVVAGGESGHGARPMHPAWARSLRDQCAAAGVAYLFKQWGEWAPDAGAVPGGDYGGDMRADRVRFLQGDGREPDGHFRRGDAAVRRVGKKAAGRTLDGRLHDEYPRAA